MGFKEPQNRLAHWLEYIAEYNFEIQHRPGVKHCNADALSRNPPEPDHNVMLCALPCGGCPHCTRYQQQWADFRENADNVSVLGSHSQNSVRALTRQQLRNAVSSDSEPRQWFTMFSNEEISQMQHGS